MSTAHPVVLIAGPAPDSACGVSMHVSTLMGSSLAQGHRLIRFAVDTGGGIDRGIGSKARRLGRLLLSPLRMAWQVLWNRVAVVHLNASPTLRSFGLNVAYLLVAKACGARVAYQVHASKLSTELLGSSGPAIRLLRRVLMLPDVLVVLDSEQLKSYSRFVPDQRVVLVPNGVDCPPFPGVPAATRGGVPDDTRPLRLAYVGALARSKGLYEMLQALRLARAHGTHARLVVAGSGPEEASLRRYAEELRLKDEVTFAATPTPEEKAGLLAGADVFLLPSQCDGLPHVLLQAMAAGTPVIVTPVGAIPDVVQDKVHGIFVPVKNAGAIARAIAVLDMDRKALQGMGEACRARVAALYSTEMLAARIARLYGELHRREPGTGRPRKMLPRNATIDSRG